MKNLLVKDPPHPAPCPYRTLGPLRPSHDRFWLSIFIKEGRLLTT
jgi:hypothetical protein